MIKTITIEFPEGDIKFSNVKGVNGKYLDHLIEIEYSGEPSIFVCPRANRSINVFNYIAKECLLRGLTLQEAEEFQKAIGIL